MSLDFIFASWLLWPTAIGLFVLFAILSETDHGPAAGVSIAVILGGLQLFSSYHPLTYVFEEPVRAAWVAGIC